MSMLPWPMASIFTMPKEHVLKPVIKQDIRELTGKQPFVKDAPVNLIYVADYSRMGGGKRGGKKFLFGGGYRVHCAECLFILRFGRSGNGRQRFNR